MMSGSSPDTTMTFGSGEVAMPAAGESTAEDPAAVSIESTTTEDVKGKLSTSSLSQLPRRARELLEDLDFICSGLLGSRSLDSTFICRHCITVFD